MKTAIICIIGLVGSWGHAAAESLLEGRVRLDSGPPVPGAQVLLFDLADLRAAPLAANNTPQVFFPTPDNERIVHEAGSPDPDSVPAVTYRSWSP